MIKRPFYHLSYCYSFMTSLVNEFKNYLYQLGYSEGARQTLPALVAEFLEQQQISHIGYVAQEQIIAFYDWLHVRPLKRGSGALSEAMISQYVYALRTFFSWAEVTGQTDYNPVSALKFKQPDQNSRQPLPIAAIQALFEAAATLKQKALLHVFYSCGLRRSEGEALNIRDVHFKEQLLYVREGKGARRRVVPLTQKVAADMEAYYLQERCSSAVKKVKDGDAFMLNRHGTRLQGEGYIKILNNLKDKAGIDMEITLHHLRHSIATHLLQGGMNLEYVRDFLGHRHLESTQLYAKINPQQLKQL
jgi:integrase/recombinase XerD